MTADWGFLQISGPSGAEVRNSVPVHSRRVLLVEDEAFTAGLVSAALTTGGFEVRSSASAAEARTALQDFDPDAALIDLSLGPGPNGIDLAHVMHAQHPGVALVLLTKVPDLRAAGYTMADLPPTCGFLQKEAITDTDQLIDAVEHALADQVERGQRQGPSDPNPLSALTTTQFAVLRCVAQGYTTPAIAEMRGTTTSAVEKVLGSIYDTLGITGRAGISPRSEAMRLFVKHAGLPDRD